MAFADNLRMIRKDRKMTQEALAEKLGVSRQAVSKWEAGDGYPETEKLMILARELQVSLDYLLMEQTAKPEQNEVPIPASVYRPEAKIAIATFDNMKVVMCQAVRASEVVFNGKGPKYQLNGVDGINFFGEHTTLLGWYLTKDDVQKEITAINEAMNRGDASYRLQFFVNVEYKGLTGQPRIV